jgi:hypothetical protein
MSGLAMLKAAFSWRGRSLSFWELMVGLERMWLLVRYAHVWLMLRSPRGVWAV